MKAARSLSLSLLLALSALAVPTTRADTTAPSPHDPAPAAASEAGAEPATAAIARSIAQHGYSAPRLLDLGRAQLAAGAVGPAIVSFERGLLLAPRHSALRDELQRARDRAEVAVPSPTRLEQLAGALSLHEWSLCVFAAALLCSLLLLAVGSARKHGRAWGASLATVLLLGAASLGGYAIQARELTRGIVVSDTASLQLSPFSTAESVLPLRAGESVQLRAERRDGFVRVVHPSGAQGWVEVGALAPIAAPASAG